MLRELQYDKRTQQNRHREPRSGVAIQGFAGLLRGACAEHSRSIRKDESCQGLPTTRLIVIRFLRWN